MRAKIEVWMKIGVAAVLVLGSSCSSTQSKGSVVGGARKEFQSRKTYTQGIVGGGLLGATVGALAGGLSGKKGWSPQAALTGGGIGAAAGSVAGGAHAHQKVKQRKEFAKEEQRLDLAISNAVSTRDAAIKFNQTLESRIATARANKGALQGTLADSKAVLGALDQEIKDQRSTLKAVRAVTAAPVSGDGSARLQKEISALESQRSRLARNIKLLTPSTQQGSESPA